MIEKREWVDVSDALPESGEYCIVRNVLPNKKEWFVAFDKICLDGDGWQMHHGYPELGKTTHWRYVTMAEIIELNEKKVLMVRHPIEEKYVDNWDYNWYD